MILLWTTDRVGGEEGGREGGMVHRTKRKHDASVLALPEGRKQVSSCTKFRFLLATG